MADKMTIEQVRDRMLDLDAFPDDPCIEEGEFKQMANAIDAHLAQSVQAVDVHAKAYAERLACALWRKHYADEAPQWKPMPGDLMGLLSQIDNMTTGLTRAIDNALAEGWRPIATAPKGLKILVGYRNSHGHWRNVTAIYYEAETLPMEEHSMDEDNEFAPAGWYETSETHDLINQTEYPPTHWQPLPTPPKAEE